MVKREGQGRGVKREKGRLRWGEWSLGRGKRDVRDVIQETRDKRLETIDGRQKARDSRGETGDERHSKQANYEQC